MRGGPSWWGWMEAQGPGQVLSAPRWGGKALVISWRVGASGMLEVVEDVAEEVVDSGEEGGSLSVTLSAASAPFATSLECL